MRFCWIAAVLFVLMPLEASGQVSRDDNRFEVSMGLLRANGDGFRNRGYDLGGQIALATTVAGKTDVRLHIAREGFGTDPEFVGSEVASTQPGPALSAGIGIRQYLRSGSRVRLFAQASISRLLERVTDVRSTDARWMPAVGIGYAVFPHEGRGEGLAAMAGYRFLNGASILALEFSVWFGWRHSGDV
jgi:hypothetical protein